MMIWDRVANGYQWSIGDQICNKSKTDGKMFRKVGLCEHPILINRKISTYIPYEV